jgi:hypothetical protein
MTARMPRRRRWLRIAREEYARSASTAKGRDRGLPGPVRGTRMRDITVSALFSRSCREVTSSSL